MIDIYTIRTCTVKRLLQATKVWLECPRYRIKQTPYLMLDGDGLTNDLARQDFLSQRSSNMRYVQIPFWQKAGPPSM